MNTVQRQVKCLPYVKMSDRVSSTWTVPALCKAYAWPTGLVGKGVIAIIELGGGWIKSDMVKYFDGIKQPVPSIVDVSVDGTVNSNQTPKNDADVEVALDIQVAASAYYVATGHAASIRVYWAQDIGTAVIAAAKDGCSVCSISWGADEKDWGVAEASKMEAAALEATKAGMIVFAASGDNDSSDGGPGSANVDLPAGCPSVVGCGGTKKTASLEIVWNNNPGKTNGEGTGGGFSTLFARPTWQTVPAFPHKRRMVPDVSAVGDPTTGYVITTYGQSMVVGGTSAVAPLYAGLFASFGQKLGFVTDKLWSNQHCFNDITIGNNGEFSAVVGPDPCSGLGSPKANSLATLFQAQAK